MKIIAFYLPQFHTIAENDSWWGKGFTEWTNVKKSTPQFKGHIQPEVPLNDNYYNLLNETVQVEQAKMAREYGVDGFCYYHYWFEGKLLLEKPMENMLSNKDVDIPFCICWANETWSRTWDGAESEILIKQNYDDTIEGWKKHFDYLLPFFKDDRYIKVNGKPMILIYKPQLIEKCSEMLSYWNDLAKKSDLEGLYIGYQHCSAFSTNLEEIGFDFGVEFEPMYTVREQKKNRDEAGLFYKSYYFLTHPKQLLNQIKHRFFKKSLVVSYDEIWQAIVSRKPLKNRKVMPGAFTSWDNTPRRGNRSIVFHESTPEKFKHYFLKQINRAQDVYSSDFIFINAWNEWAEGAHLEPDQLNRYGYLEAIKDSKEKIDVRYNKK